MQAIDGVIIRKGDIIETKFCKTLLNDLSTGCKSIILAVFYEASKYVVSIDECGENALKILFKIGEKIDIRVFTSSYIKINE